jgi:hypothetical protein
MRIYRVIKNFYLNILVLFLVSFLDSKPILFPQVVIFTWVLENMEKLLGPIAEFNKAFKTTPLSLGVL